MDMDTKESEAAIMRQSIEKRWKEKMMKIGIIKKKVDNKRAGPRYRKSGAGGVILSSRLPKG